MTDHRLQHRRRLAALVFMVGVAAAAPALAHPGTGVAGGFTSGFLHPLNGFDHLLAMFAVGLWGAFLGRPLVVALPVIFPTMMAFGGLLGMSNAPLPPVELGIAVSVLALGVLIAAAAKAPVWAACLVVGVFAVFHGYAHGRELPSAADPVAYSVGFVLATGLLHLLGIAVGLIRARRGGDTVARGIGGLIAAAGVYFLYQAVT